VAIPFTETRRRILQSSGALAASSVVGTLGLLQHRTALASGTQLVSASSPYGPLAPVNDLATGLPLLQLPAGFSYRSHGWTNDVMTDGRPTPSNHDAMGVIETRRVGRSVQHVIVRNHERAVVSATTNGGAIVAPAVYDSALVNGPVTVSGVPIGTVSGYSGGGTTTMVFADGQWRSSVSSLAGTLGNCAGGVTPWGTWLSCEETVADLTPLGGKPHGYVFEVDSEPADTIATPIVEMGRFVHEAVAVDPATGYIYETEDNRNVSGFYRYIPDDLSGTLGSLHKGGTLQASRIKTILNKAVPATLAEANNLGFLNPQIGDEYELEWVDIANPDANPAVVTGQPGGVTQAVMAGPTIQALAAGCARWSRGEGIWYAAGKMFIVDTAAGVDGGNRPGRGEGAVWELTLATMRIKAIFVSGASTVGNNPDNIVVSPRGGIILCEDGGASVDAFGSGSRLLGLNSAAQAYIFCKNNLNFTSAQFTSAGKAVTGGDLRGIEFCGACFEPSGRTLFVNIQTPGITFAITGPWAKGNL
jgi:uncharacterized protein